MGKIDTYLIMQTQAGTRPIYTMTNGRFNVTSHYRDRAEFQTTLVEKNAEALQWGDKEWIEVIK